MTAPNSRRRLLLGAVAASFGARLAHAQAPPVAHLAVASSMAEVVQALVTAFAASQSARLSFSLGATAKLYAQIKNGAPFNALLAADQSTPATLEREGLVEPGSRFGFATGRLVLWSNNPSLLSGDGSLVLRQQKFRKLAIANPLVAPYGAAAEQTLAALGLREALQAKLVFGESVGQAHHFVHSGAAELGFVAMSQVFFNAQLRRGSAWVVPHTLHQALRHDAVLLPRAAGKPSAQAFLSFLRTPPARALLLAHGFE